MFYQGELVKRIYDVQEQVSVPASSSAQLCRFVVPVNRRCVLVKLGNMPENGGENSVKFRLLRDGIPDPDFSGIDNAGYFGAFGLPYEADDVNTISHELREGEVIALEAINTDAANAYLVNGRIRVFALDK